MTGKTETASEAAPTSLSVSETLDEIRDSFDPTTELYEQLPVLLEIMASATGSEAGMLWRLDESEDSYVLTDVINIDIESVPQNSPHMEDEAAEFSEVFENNACVLTGPDENELEPEYQHCGFAQLVHTHNQIRIPVIWDGRAVAGIGLFQQVDVDNDWDLHAIVAASIRMEQWWDWHQLEIASRELEARKRRRLK